MAFSEYPNFTAKKIVHGITMKTTSAERRTCSFYGNSMNNLLSYCGLIDAKIRASDKDLPVIKYMKIKQRFSMYLIVFVKLYIKMYK